MRPMPWAIVGQATTPHELQVAIDSVVANNLAQLASGDIPPLYESGVVYERETRAAPPRGVERFQTARDCYMLGHADCDGLAPWRAAELIYEGEPARAKVIPSEVGYHVLVHRGDGSVEDPSALLGMLDGYRLEGTDARPTARARRRRMMAGLVRKGRELVQRAAATQGAPQRALLAKAQQIGRMVNGLERQAAADGEPPLSDAEVEPSDDGSVAGIVGDDVGNAALSRLFGGLADQGRALVVGQMFGPVVLVGAMLLGLGRRHR
jgi:hypothetical protein